MTIEDGPHRGRAGAATSPGRRGAQLIRREQPELVCLVDRRFKLGRGQKARDVDEG